ncbi:hypothetical protein [Pseudoxanthomonas dokdonensis]|uniref:Uncharacterized protein n=1 Tax=Pseudoxanthomonas dokdonensis TaxID=344882 RepID=A0A0R0CV05_9GAMM|nr:hypothetical protein [Pseudoxanthomonas dokdonensis]KRG69123.1 hypothetical protein ABB29_11960 [Pseudoxanthomonas dokdonensis]
MANNFAEAMQEGYAFGTRQRQEREQAARNAELQGLAPLAIGGDVNASNRAFALDPKAASAYQGQGDRLRGQLRGLAKSLKQSSNNPQLQAALYRSALPLLKAQSWGGDVPDEFDAAQVMPVAEQILAMTDGVKTANGVPAGFQQFQLTAEAAGLKPGTPEYQQAARIALGQEGRAATGGFSFEMIRGADGRERPARRDPRTGMVEVFSDSAGWTPLGGAGNLGGGRPSSLGNPTFTGPDGMPIAIDPLLPAELQAQIRDNPAAFNAAPSGSSVDFGAAATGLATGRSPEEQAALTTAAQEAAKLKYLPQVQAIQANAAIAQTAGQEQAKSEAERNAAARTKAPQLLNVERGLNRIDMALQKLDQGVIGDTGPIDQYYKRFTPEGQELDAAIGSIQNDMLALTRVPGVGSQSDLEQKIANLKYPSLANDPAVNLRNLQQLRAFIKDLSESLGRSQPAAGAAPGGWSIQRVE